MEKTTLKTTHRKTGWTTLIVFPTGEKLRYAGYATREDAENAARAKVKLRRSIEHDPKMRELLEV